MDVVVCLALKECFFFNKNLYFIRKNLKPSNIYVISDKRNFKYLHQNNSDIIFIDENSLLENLNFREIKKVMDLKKFRYRQYGWYFQQFLKIGFAFSKYARDEYLVWDADTVPFNLIEFKKDGKYLILPKREHNKDYFTCIDKLFDAPLKADYSFISEHMVFNVAVVKEMLGKIQDKYPSLTWYEACLNAVNPDAHNGFSEFETYGTYCLNYHSDVFSLRNLRTFRHCGKIYGILAKQKEIEGLKDDLDTGSFEIYDYPISNIRRMIQFFYVCWSKIVSKIRVKFV